MPRIYLSVFPYCVKFSLYVGTPRQEKKVLSTFAADNQTEHSMNKLHYTLMALLLALAFATPAAMAQVYSLDSLRAMALRQNKQMAESQAAIDKAHYEHRAARTNYLPKVQAVGTYMRTGDEISLLSDDQKASLSSMGTRLGNGLNAQMGQIVAQNPDLAPLIQQLSPVMGQMGQSLNAVGQGLVDALHTDTRNMSLGAILLTQPIYMGGKIRAYDAITRYAEDVAGEHHRATGQQVILEVDRAYWQLVSLLTKRQLAESYSQMLARLDDDLQKMMAQGLVTRADVMSVGVKHGEAELTLAKVDDALTLSRMLLCQLCGLPLDTPVAPRRNDTDEADSTALLTAGAPADTAMAWAQRPELRQLERATRIYREKVRIARSAFLPQVALMGGYLTTNPSLTNGFARRFRGTWAVGVTVKVPVWQWGEGRYKVRAAEAEAQMKAYQREDALEKVQLQVNQSSLRVAEAQRQYRLALSNRRRADENLRVARASFAAETLSTSDLLAAHTAWLQAQSDCIDARIDIRLSRTEWQKALGILGE